LAAAPRVKEWIYAGVTVGLAQHSSAKACGLSARVS
jgi:hypothetical protein